MTPRAAATILFAADPCACNAPPSLYATASRLDLAPGRDINQPLARSLMYPTPPDPPVPAVPAAMDPIDPLEQLNHAFRDAYAARKQAVLAAMGPAIAAIDDLLIFRVDGQRMVGPSRTRIYHELKTLCHLPLALQAILESEDDHATLDPPARARLDELRRHLPAITDGLAARSFSASQLACQRRILAASDAFIADVLARGGCSIAGLRDFLRAQTPDIQRNIEDATRDQLDAMHATFGAWTRRMSLAQWSELRVIVGSSHMARTGNVAAQYFAIALGDSWEGRFEHEDLRTPGRVFTSEVATDETTAFALLAMHAFDARAANKFFAEDTRLGRDVLANAAERQLTAMFGVRPIRPDLDV